VSIAQTGHGETKMAFKKAVKHNAKLRLAVSGPAGSGKTFTLLKLATELARDSGGRVAFVDTEHGSASKYAHGPTCTSECADPSHFDFDVIEPSSFDPRKLIEDVSGAIKDGYSVFVCDSLSHYWMGPDGELEMVDNAAKASRSGNSFAAWKTVTPIHNQLVDTMLRSPIHILVSMRTKTEWVIEKDEKGKSVPRKVGLQPVMRDGIEFEFDVCGDIDQDNTLTITKTRCSALTGKSINRPGREMADVLKTWLGSPSATEPRGDGQPGAAESPTESPNPVPAQAAPIIPKPLEVIVRNMEQGKAGAVRAAFDFLKAYLVQVSPERGLIEYQRIREKHQLAAGTTVKQCIPALIEMYEAGEFLREAQVENTAKPEVTDADLPSDLFGSASLIEGANN
jgi:AAA domain